LRAADQAAAASCNRKTSILAGRCAAPARISAQNVPDRGAHATGPADYEPTWLFGLAADGAALAIPLIIHIVNDA